MTTPLRAKYIRDLTIRGRAERTQQCYSRYVSELACYYQRSPELISYQEVADWLYYLVKERKLSASSVNIAVNAVRFLYGVTLERNTDQLMASVPRMKHAIRRAEIYARNEVEAILSAPRQPRDRVFLMAVYACGLRLAEARHLKTDDIDRARMQLRVRKGKGGKERVLPLSNRLLKELGDYWRAQRQGKWGHDIPWLFLGYRADWGQKLDFHPHLHCIVTGGALSPDSKQWRSPKQRKFLFPVQAVAVLFRGKFLAGLRQMLAAGELHLPDSGLKIPAPRARWLSLLYGKRWVLYAKRPFGGAQQVLSYLANYTHRVALSNRRIVAVDAQHQTVTFTYRDYRHGSQLKELTLSALEFIRRFSLHILPPGLVRIRHYGILGNNRRKRAIEAARAIFKTRGRAVELQPPNLADKPMCCPSCGKAGIRLLAFTDAAGVLHMIGAASMSYDSS